MYSQQICIFCGDQVPVGWMTRTDQDRKLIRMPFLKKQFPSLFAAFQYMVKHDYLLSQVQLHGFQASMLTMPCSGERGAGVSAVRGLDVPPSNTGRLAGDGSM